MCGQYVIVPYVAARSVTVIPARIYFVGCERNFLKWLIIIVNLPLQYLIKIQSVKSGIL